MGFVQGEVRTQGTLFQSPCSAHPDLSYRSLPAANANSAAKEAEIGTKVEFAGKTYIPGNVDLTVLAALRIPSSRGPLAAQPTSELFDDVCKRLAEFVPGRC